MWRTIICHTKSNHILFDITILEFKVGILEMKFIHVNVQHFDSHMINTKLWWILYYFSSNGTLIGYAHDSEDNSYGVDVAIH